MLYPLQEAVTHTCTHARSLIHTHKMQIGGSYSLSYFLCLCMDVHVKKGFSLVIYSSLDLARGQPWVTLHELSSSAESARTGVASVAFAGCNSTENLQSHWASVPGLLLCNVSLQPGVNPILSSTSLTQTNRERQTCTRETGISEKAISCIEYRIDQ